MSTTRLGVVIIGVVVALAVDATGLAQQRTPDRDLTLFSAPVVVEEPPPGRDGSIVEGRPIHTIGDAVVEGGGTAPRTPLRVRLVNVAPSTCVVAEPIAFDVELQNIGGTALGLPWSPDSRDEGVAAPGTFTSLAIWLNTKGADGPHVLGNVGMLYGDTKVPFSVRVLQPRETVVVRVPAKCATAKPEAPPAPLASNRVPVQAQVELRAGQNYGGRRAASTEAVVLTVLKQ